jgi:hypothetical protein
MTTPIWKTSETCSHSNSQVCPTCDFDRYYATAYPDTCPWAVSAEPTDPSTEPIATIPAASKSTAHYSNVGPRAEAPRVAAADVLRDTGLTDVKALRRGARADRFDRGLWITSLVLMSGVAVAAVWALIAEPMGWLP